MTNKRELYNSDIEIGVRVLLILKFSKKSLTSDELNLYDFLSLHSDLVKEDIDIRPNIHPSNPSFGLELYSKKNILNEAIHMLIHKGLVDVDISNDVIAYKANQLTHLLLTYFESEYFSILSRETLLVVNEMSKFTKNELQEFVNEKLTTWHTFIEFD